MNYFLCMLGLSFSLFSVSGNSVSGNDSVNDAPALINPFLKENKSESEEKEKENENKISVSDKVSDQVVPVADPDVQKIETGGVESEKPIQILVSMSDNSTGISDNSLSVNDLISLDQGIQMVNVQLAALLDASLNPTISASQLSDYYKNYFIGILQNMPYTEYLCYAERVYSGTSYNNYSNHYYLLYDLEFDNDGYVIEKAYPAFDIYSENGIYYCNQINKRFAGYPTFGFASFAPYSALIDRSFNYNDLYIALISVFALFIIGRKTLFS